MSKKVSLLVKGISFCGILISAATMGHLAATDKYASNDQLIEAGVLNGDSVLVGSLNYIRLALKDIKEQLLWKS